MDPFERFRELFPRTVPEARDPADRRRRLLAIVLSLLVACALWFTVQMREVYVVSLQSPLEVRELPQGQALRAPPPRAVNMQVQGVGWDLLALRRNPPTVALFADGEEVDLLRAATESAQLPAGVIVQTVQPQALDLSLDAAVSRRLPVRLTGSIDLRPGYGLLAAPRLTPDSVRVRGARSLLDRFTFWPTEPFVVEGLRRSATSTVPLSDTLAGLVALSAERVQVTLRVGQFTEGSRTLAVRVEGVPPGVSAVRLIPERVRATYLVPTEGEHYARAETTDDFYAVVDYTDIARDTTAGTVPVRPRVPEGLPIQGVRLVPRRLEYFTVRE